MHGNRSSFDIEERKWFQTSLDRYQISNEGLRAGNQRLRSELHKETCISEGETGSEIGAQKKRSRQAIIAAAGDAVDVDTAGREGKRAKMATDCFVRVFFLGLVGICTNGC